MTLSRWRIPAITICWIWSRRWDCERFRSRWTTRASVPRPCVRHYGRGYALMRLDRKDEAVSAYCKAISLGDTALRREIQSVMQQNGLACH